MYFKIYCHANANLTYLCVFLFLVLMFDAESVLDCKKIFVIFSLLTLIMLVGAESIGIVVELQFTALQDILVIWSADSSPITTPFLL